MSPQAQSLDLLLLQHGADRCDRSSLTRELEAFFLRQVLRQLLKVFVVLRVHCDVKSNRIQYILLINRAASMRYEIFRPVSNRLLNSLWVLPNIQRIPAILRHCLIQNVLESFPQCNRKDCAKKSKINLDAFVDSVHS